MLALYLKNGVVTLTATTLHITGTLDQLNAGADTGRLHTAKLLNDWIKS